MLDVIAPEPWGGISSSPNAAEKDRGRQAFRSLFPQINSMQMKSGNINRPESLGCAPLTLKPCPSTLKQYLVRD